MRKVVLLTALLAALGVPVAHSAVVDQTVQQHVQLDTAGAAAATSGASAASAADSAVSAADAVVSVAHQLTGTVAFTELAHKAAHRQHSATKPTPEEAAAAAAKQEKEGGGSKKAEALPASHGDATAAAQLQAERLLAATKELEKDRRLLEEQERQYEQLGDEIKAATQAKIELERKTAAELEKFFVQGKQIKIVALDEMQKFEAAHQFDLAEPGRAVGQPEAFKNADSEGSPQNVECPIECDKTVCDSGDGQCWRPKTDAQTGKRSIECAPFKQPSTFTCAEGYRLCADAIFRNGLSFTMRATPAVKAASVGTEGDKEKEKEKNKEKEKGKVGLTTEIELAGVNLSPCMFLEVVPEDQQCNQHGLEGLVKVAAPLIGGSNGNPKIKVNKKDHSMTATWPAFHVTKPGDYRLCVLQYLYRVEDASDPADATTGKGKSQSQAFVGVDEIGRVHVLPESDDPPAAPRAAPPAAAAAEDAGATKKHGGHLKGSAAATGATAVHIDAKGATSASKPAAAAGDGSGKKEKGASAFVQVGNRAHHTTQVDSNASNLNSNTQTGRHSWIGRFTNE